MQTLFDNNNEQLCLAGGLFAIDSRYWMQVAIVGVFCYRFVFGAQCRLFID